MDEDFGFINPSDFFAFLDGAEIFSGTKLLLTFDDGFKSCRAMADQVLNEMGIKAVFFVCPKIIEDSVKSNSSFEAMVQQNIFDAENRSLLTRNDFSFLNWDDLKALVKDGHCVGAHTLSHKRLSTIKDINELRDEIILSKDFLEKNLNVKIDCFAYPFGDNKSIQASGYKIIKNQFRYCFTGLRGINLIRANPHYLFRDQIEIENSDQFNRSILEGMMDWYYWLKMNSLKKIIWSSQK
jgi:peptidoglycan/xylan/chitin deacetylase (PgdA/CDA1 family)